MKKFLVLAFCILNSLHIFGQVVSLSNAQKDSIVYIHNFYRINIGSGMIEWSDDLENKAKNWLVQYRSKPLITRNPYGYEQNLYVLPDTNFRKAIDFWAEEQVFYNGNFSDSARLYLYQHYFRMINPEFSHLGCALSRQVDGVYVFVCFYSQ